MGVDVNGVARPVLVDSTGRIITTTHIIGVNGEELLLNPDGSVVIAGESLDGSLPNILVTRDGKVVITEVDDMGFFQVHTQHGTALSPADSLVYYHGNGLSAPVVTADRAKVRILTACTLIKSVLEITVAGTLGTAENSTFVVRVNNSVDYPVFTTVQLTAAINAYISGTLAVPFVAGDYFEWKQTCPIWVTNPTTVSVVSYNLFQLP